MIKKYIYLPVYTLALMSCGSNDSEGLEETQSSVNLDEAAISAGILPDPDNVKLEGRFETRSDIGTDKFCAIADGSDYKVGILAVFGADSKCEGRGVAQYEGEQVNIKLNQNAKGDLEEECEFTASYDGISLQLPGDLPQSCAKVCNNRASLAGTQYYLAEEGNDAARQSNGNKIKPLCQG